MEHINLAKNYTASISLNHYKLEHYKTVPVYWTLLQNIIIIIISIIIIIIILS